MSEEQKFIDVMHKLAVEKTMRELRRLYFPPMRNLSKKVIPKTILYPGHVIKIGFFDRLQMRWSGIMFWFKSLWK